MKDKFLLIDANALVHRAFHALPPLTSPKGELVNAVYGFLTILFRAIGEVKPKYIAAAFDHPKPTFRHKEYEEYKAKRVKASPMLYEQIPKIKEILAAMEIPVFEQEGYEADDLIATICEKLNREHNVETVIVTGDKDAFQLIDENTCVYTMRRALSETIIYTPEILEKKFGFGAGLMVDYKALRGDPSDNIAGVAGIGEKTATELIVKFGSLENIYKNLENITGRTKELLKKDEENAKKSKKLVTLEKNVPLEFELGKCRLSDYGTEGVEKLFLDYGFKSLIGRLPASSRDRQLKINEIVENQFNASLRATAKQSFNEEVDCHGHQKWPRNDKNKRFPTASTIIKETAEKTETNELDEKLEPVLREMEKIGIKIDPLYFQKLSIEAGKKIEKIEKKIYQTAGHEFNPSSPSQLAKVLYDELHLEEKLPQEGEFRIRKKKTHRSTAAGELEKLADIHPIVSLILSYRQLAKLKNTYLEPLPKLVDERGRLHTHFAQDTSTGRLSSKNPNLQNIPMRTDWGQKIRRGFIAEAGYQLVCFDYSQIELRLLAHIAKEKAMTQAFADGKDIHDETARELKITERRIAKAVNFGINYGLSAYGLSQNLKIPLEQAQAFIDAYFAAYPRVSQYIMETTESAREKGYVESLFGRKRYLPEINSPNYQVRQAAQRMAINMPIQGTAADIIKMAMIEVNKQLTINNKQIKMLLQVHDELVFEIFDDSCLLESVKKIKEIMEKIVKLDVPLVVNVSRGRNWGEQEEIKIKNQSSKIKI